MTTQDFTLVYGNIKSNPMMKPEHARHDIVQALRLAQAHHAHAIVLVEMAPSYKKILKPLARKYGYRKYAKGKAVILWRADLAFGARVARRMGQGVKHVMETRYMLTVRLKLAFPLVFGGTHFVAGWWWRKTTTVQTRIADAQIAKVKKVAKAKKKAGVPFVAAGDFNTPKSLAKVLDGVLLNPVKGVMHAYLFLPDGWTARVKAKGYVGTGTLYTDHPIGWATVAITSPS